MNWKIWKKPNERAREEMEKAYKKGINRSNWSAAFSYFNSAYKLFQKANDRAAATAKAMSLFSAALKEPAKTENWFNAAKFMKNLDASFSLEETPSALILSEECHLKAYELQLKNNVTPGERVTLLEKMAKLCSSLGAETLTIPILLGKQRISGNAKGKLIFDEYSKLEGQIRSANELYLESWRKYKIEFSSECRIEFPCGCFFKAFPTTLRHISNKNCHFHRSPTDLLILKNAKQRKTANGYVEPLSVQAVHDVISANRLVDVEEISKQTGLTHEEIGDSLEWLDKYGEIDIPDDLLKGRKRPMRRASPPLGPHWPRHNE